MESAGGFIQKKIIPAKEFLFGFISEKKDKKLEKSMVTFF